MGKMNNALCRAFIVFFCWCVCKKDTFPGKSPDEVAVVYQELREPAKKKPTNESTQQIVQLIKIGLKAYTWHNLYLYFV